MAWNSLEFRTVSLPMLKPYQSAVCLRSRACKLIRSKQYLRWHADASCPHTVLHAMALSKATTHRPTTSRAAMQSSPRYVAYTSLVEMEFGEFVGATHLLGLTASPLPFNFVGLRIVLISRSILYTSGPKKRCLLLLPRGKRAKRIRDCWRVSEDTHISKSTNMASYRTTFDTCIDQHVQQY